MRIIGIIDLPRDPCTEQYNDPDAISILPPRERLSSEQRLRSGSPAQRQVTLGQCYNTLICHITPLLYNTAAMLCCTFYSMLYRNGYVLYSRCYMSFVMWYIPLEDVIWQSAI